MQSRPSSPALDSCLKLVWEHDPENGKFNPDSVMVDTCDAERTWYAKRGFRIRTTSQVLDTSCGDPFERHGHECIDSTHETYPAWQRLDSAYPSYEVAQVETILTPDSLFLCHEYELTFESYQNVSDWKVLVADYFDNESIRHESHALRSLGVNYQSEQVAVCSDDVFEWAGLSSTHQHAPSLVWSRMYWRSFMSPLMDLKVPMAWQITMGAPSVYTAVADPTNGGPEHGTEVSHPDLTYAPAGNFFYLPPQQNKPSRTKRLTPGNRHTNVAMGLTVGQFNDVGIVGLAPKSRVVAVLANDRVHEFPDSHVPLHVNPSWVLKHPQIVTNPHETGSDTHVKDVASSGSIVIGSVSNQPGEVFDVSDPNNVTTYLGAVCAKPGNAVWADPSNSISEADVQVLTIGGYSWNAVNKPDEEKQSSDFQGWRWLDDCMPQVNPFVNVVTQDHNFGCFHGTKFPPSTLTRADRLASKSLAPLDVVAPNVALGIDFHPTTHQPRYTTLEQGNSQNQHYGAGIAALMISVKDRFALQGMAVQRHFYNIVTFTADKLLDPIPSQNVGSDPTVFPSDHMHPSLLTTGSPKKLNTVYRAQPNDHLDRYWAIRMGFGRLNAFRSVAHSIPGVGTNSQPNVKYTYAGTDNLDWANAHEMNGNNGLGTVKYLHLGKYKNATDLVLEHGGVKFEGEPDYLNSNGKSIVNKNLSVGSAQGLVIDGIVDTDVTDNTQYPAITTTSESGRILITGWLRRVRLDGRIYAVDLRVVNDGAGEAPKLVCRGGQSELHDTLWLRNNTKLVVEDGGTLDLMPGAIVIMSQGSSITVKSGGKVNLHHAARIVPAGTYTTQQPTVTLEGGGGMATVYRYDAAAERVAEQSENIVIETRLSLNANSTLRVKQCVDFVYPSLDVYVITADPAANIILEPNAYLRQRNQATLGVAGGIRFPTLVAPVGGAEARYRVDIPTTIPAGPLVVVPPGTNLELGRVKVEYNGGVEVSPGATLTLLEKEVEWNGILHVEGTSGNRATVRAAMELDQNLCGQALASRRAWPTLLKMIPGEFPYMDLNYNDSRPIAEKLGCYLFLEHAQMLNVFTLTSSMPIVGMKDGSQTLGYAANTVFKGNRNDIRSALSASTDAQTLDLRTTFLEQRSTMLDVIHNRSLLRALRDIRRNATTNQDHKALWLGAWSRINGRLGQFDMSNCQFRDDGGKVEAASNYTTMQPVEWATATASTPPTAYYVLNGIGATGLTRVRVDASHFANLTTGVSIKAGEPDLTVTESNFANVVEGVVARGNHAQICNSNFSRTRIGVSSVRGTVRVNECSFGEGMSSSTNGAMISSETAGMMGIGVELDESMLWARSNDFRDYNTAIRALGVSQVWLSDRRTCLGSNCNTIEVDGRNRFRGMTTGEGETPFWKQSQWADLLWHVKQDETKPDYFVHCGLNDHSGQLRTIVNDNVLYHNYLLTRDDPNSTTTASVNPNDNEFNTDQDPRVLNVVLSPALTERDKEWLTNDDCEYRIRNAASNPEIECVLVVPNPPGELEFDSWWDVVQSNQMGQIPAPVVAQLRPAPVDPSTLTEQQRQDHLLASNNYWRYANAPWSNRSEWLILHLRILEADTLWPTNTDSVIGAMSAVLTDTNESMALRRQILAIMESLFIERENCAGAVTLHSNMISQLYSTEERDAMFFMNSTAIVCNQDSVSIDSMAASANRELFAYIHRNQSADTLEKRRDAFRATHSSSSSRMELRTAPNPASDMLSIEFRVGVDKATPYTIELVSVLGAVAEHVNGTSRGLAVNTVSLNVSHLPRGVYVLRLVAAGNSASTLVVIR